LLILPGRYGNVKLVFLEDVEVEFGCGCFLEVWLLLYFFAGAVESVLLEVGLGNELQVLRNDLLNSDLRACFLLLNQLDYAL